MEIDDYLLMLIQNMIYRNRLTFAQINQANLQYYH